MRLLTDCFNGSWIKLFLGTIPGTDLSNLWQNLIHGSNSLKFGSVGNSLLNPALIIFRPPGSGLETYSYFYSDLLEILNLGGFLLRLTAVLLFSPVSWPKIDLFRKILRSSHRYRCGFLPRLTRRLLFSSEGGPGQTDSEKANHKLLCWDLYFFVKWIDLFEKISIFFRSS